MQWQILITKSLNFLNFSKKIKTCKCNADAKLVIYEVLENSENEVLVVFLLINQVVSSRVF